MDTVAIHLYDLRKTGYIERDEVPSLPYKIDLTMDRYLLDHHLSFSKLFPALYFCFCVGGTFHVNFAEWGSDLHQKQLQL